MKTMPAIFVGHGSPMNIVRNNQWTKGWVALGNSIPPPKGILAVSAHWYIEATKVTAMPRPRTIHDFGGFPRELYAIEYPAPGDPDLASLVQTLLSPIGVDRDEEWGLDHGTWSVLYHMFPRADIPVVQLSINRRESPPFHYQLGRMLSPLRDEGILILASGNLVHNLRAYDWDRPDVGAFNWASTFEDRVRQLLRDGQNASLIDYEALGREAELSIPTPDHYLPLLYTLGARRGADRTSFPVEGFDGGSVSMLAVKLSEKSSD